MNWKFLCLVSHKWPSRWTCRNGILVRRCRRCGKRETVAMSLSDVENIAGDIKAIGNDMKRVMGIKP